MFILIKNDKICIIILLFNLLSCLSVQKEICPEKLDQLNQEFYGFQWCGENTVIATGKGVPGKNIKDIEKRKISSRNAAVLQAQYMIIEKFKGACIGGACGGDFYNSGLSEAYLSEISGIAKSGTVSDCVWDNEQNCEVLYKTGKSGLKQLILRCSP